VEWLREVGMPADYVNRLARMFQDIKVRAKHSPFTYSQIYIIVKLQIIFVLR